MLTLGVLDIWVEVPLLLILTLTSEFFITRIYKFDRVSARHIFKSARQESSGCYHLVLNQAEKSHVC